MAKLFLDGIFKENPSVNDSPSAVFITMPQLPSGTFCKNYIITGLMANDPTWTAANSWGPVISDLANLQDWASLIGAQSQVSWINASTMCWKGTAPLSLSIEFYLINYSKSLGLEGQLAMLTKLAAVHKAPGKDGVAGEFMVNVHGGYAADVLTGNNALFDRKKNIEDFVRGKQGEALSELNSLDERLYQGGFAKGALSIRFGHKAIIDNLLISKINVTTSTVEVAEQNGGNPRPLYYKVSLTLTGTRPLITTDVDSMYGNLSSRGTTTGGDTVSPKESGLLKVAKEVLQVTEDHPVITTATAASLGAATAASGMGMIPMSPVTSVVSGLARSSVMKNVRQAGSTLRNKFIKK